MSAILMVDQTVAQLHFCMLCNCVSNGELLTDVKREIMICEEM